MKLLLRLAEPEELPDILQLQALSLRILLASTTDPETLESLIRHQQLEREKLDELILVATCNHDFVGFVALQMLQAQISGLFIHPDFVRQGIGSELVLAVEALMHRKNRRSLTVMASEYAKPFYKHMGFKTIRRHYLFVQRRQKVRVFWMRKSLRDVTPEEEQQQTTVFAVLTILTILSVLAAIA
ncbi:MAG: GNAT family N-acetyltransferase [Limnothrix sp. RL_2_0]|nr:GNAT family N-acetyltransferase [Limnothrix sp. RL_2_0]